MLMGTGAMRMADHAAPPPAPVPPRYVRRRDGRLIAGVAGGLADHLRLPVLPVRIGFAVLAGFSGLGILLYAGYWIFVPQAPAHNGEVPRGLASHERRGLRSLPARVMDEQPVGQLLALLALALGAVSLGQVAGFGMPAYLFWPAVAVVAGLTVLWRQADEAPDPQTGQIPTPVGRWTAGRAFALARFVGGALLVVLGALSFLFLTDPSAALQGFTGGLVVVLGAVLIAGPWLLRGARSLAAERAERIRSQAHADMAAHLHDSVLQTLALIQRQAHDPREVIRLARMQERDLRSFLYADPGAESEGSGESFAASLRAIRDSVEDTHGIPVELVTVGDGPVGEARGAVLGAVREAMTNAAKHSGAAMIDVYAEVEEGSTAVYVRDRGKGFSLDDVPADRAGIRHSIQGRMERHGGTARVNSGPGEGTEVEIRVGGPA
jgi:phage shock protein PspC (stress-responsive transcriptional regulator)/signal transduction histidine kinase